MTKEEMNIVALAMAAITASGNATRDNLVYQYLCKLAGLYNSTHYHKVNGDTISEVIQRNRKGITAKPYCWSELRHQ
jgi:hypothetical protein